MKLFWACLFSILSCTNIKKENNEPKISISENYNIVKTDSIYPNKNYRIIIDDFAKETSWNDDEYNTVFKFQKLENQEYKTLYSDSIQCHFHEILFEDFNGDDVKDILIQNISDVRSNLTYYLYLVDSENERLKKIKNFNSIKNPKYHKKYDIIDNMVMSGRDWSAFYVIEDDSIKSFETEEYTVYWGQDENGNPENPDEEYEKKLKKILEIRKK